MLVTEKRREKVVQLPLLVSEKWREGARERSPTQRARVGGTKAKGREQEAKRSQALEEASLWRSLGGRQRWWGVGI